jgi:glycosyltransferase involved in cell wall biosynthesis
MRILIATHHLGIVGGIEKYLQSALPRLIGAGFEVAILGEQGDAGSGIAASCPGAALWTADGKSAAAVLSEVGDWRPDVVYAHGLHDPQLERALADRFPTVLFAHTYHGTCVSGTKCRSRPEHRPCRRTLGLACLALYLPCGCGGRNPFTMFALYRTQRRRRANLSRYRAVLVASRHMADEYRRHGVQEDRLRLVPLFPTDAVPDLAPPAPRPRSDRVLFVGRLTAQKGIRHLVEAVGIAAAELGRRLTLVVAGDGTDRADVEADARRLGIPLELLGWVASERRNAEMRAADVLAVPSLWPEPFGLVGLEAGCFGLPAVGFATGGIPDWLISGLNGESVPGDRPHPTPLAAALVRALADDDHLQQLRVGAWEVVHRFTPEAHLERLSEILRAAGCSGSRLLLEMRPS